MKAKISAKVWSRDMLHGILLVCFISLSACANPTSTLLVPTQSISLTTNTPIPAPTLSPTPISTSTSTPLNIHPQVVVLADNLPEPDDLVLAPDGSIYISDVTEGTIKAYTLDGQLNLILSGLSSPEGMAFLPDGSIVIAEQGKNRLIRYDPKTKMLASFLDLVNHTSNLGVDGIVFDGTNLIVPDSPNGTVLEVSVDGKSVRQLTSGLARPTGAWREPSEDLLILDENGGAVFRLHPDGVLEKVAALSVPDDAIEDARGNIFAVTLGDGAVHVLMAGTNKDVILVSGLNNPQGIIFDADGNLIVTDSGNHRLLKVLIH
jgi:sugar lactone lactonase YvrE